jgi:uncharacterized protein (TIGR02996 family)
MRSFTCVDGKSSKFWNIDLQGCRFTLQYGKIGSSGQSQVKEFPNEAAALKAHDKLIAEKLGKGYTEATAAVPAASTAPARRRGKGPLNDPVLTALLEACWEKQDDAAMPALADWLDEHGLPERAEHHRIQFDLLGTRQSGNIRKRELEAAHKREWLGPALADALDQVGIEDRGYVALTFCGGWLWGMGVLDPTDEDVNRVVEALAASRQARWLTSLSLEDISSGNDMDLGPLASSRHLRRLTSLRLHCPGIECHSPAVDFLWGSAAAANLRELALTGECINFDTREIARSRRLTQLQYLTLQDGPGWEDWPGNEVDLRGFASSPHFPNLRYVTIHEPIFGKSFLDGLLALIRSPLLPRLEWIDFNHEKKVQEDEGDERPDYSAFARELANIPEAVRLRKLSLEHFRLGDDDIQALTASPYLAGRLILPKNKGRRRTR